MYPPLYRYAKLLNDAVSPLTIEEASDRKDNQSSRNC